MLDWLRELLGPGSRPDDEWLLELDGWRLARLVEPACEEMFWVRCRIVPPGPAGEDVLATIFDTSLWDACRFSYRNVRTGKLAPHAFSAAGTSAESLRELSVVMRGLYHS